MVIALIVVGAGTLTLRFLLPLAVAVLETIVECPLVSIAVGPFVLTETLWLAIRVLPYVHVTVREEVCSVSVSKTRFPFSFISISVEPDVHAVSLSLAGLPLPYV